MELYPVSELRTTLPTAKSPNKTCFSTGTPNCKEINHKRILPATQERTASFEWTILYGLVAFFCLPAP